MGIELLGGFRVSGVSGTLTRDRLGGRRSRLVLAVLAFDHPRAVDHHELADVLWPHQLPPTWKPAMRSAFSHVRSILREAGWSDAAIDSSEGVVTLHLSADVAIDVADARNAIAAASKAPPERAVVLASAASEVLRAPFFANESSEWADRCREKLLDMRLEAFDVLLPALLDCGRIDDAATAAREAIHLCPYHETAHRHLLAAHAAAGNRAEALLAYRRLRAMLVEEMGVEPSAETESVYLELLGGQRSSPRFTRPADESSAKAHVGRADESA